MRPRRRDDAIGAHDGDTWRDVARDDGVGADHDAVTNAYIA